MFEQLAEAGKYNGLTLHRIVPNFAAMRDGMEGMGRALEADVMKRFEIIRNRLCSAIICPPEYA